MTRSRGPQPLTPYDVAGPLAPVDAAWLRMDTDVNLMMVTAVLWFTTPLDRDGFERVVRERLLGRFPRFATRAVLGRGRPRWEPVDVDLRHHVSEAVLPAPGDQAALARLCGTLMGAPLDPDRPAWQFHLVREYEGGSALIARLHHSLADGIALARVLLALSDDEPGASAAGRAGGEAVPAAGGASPGASGPRRPAAEAGRRRPTASVLGDAVAVARVAAVTVATLGRIALLPRDPRGVFRGQLGVAKRAAWAEPVTVEEAKALGRACGGTINDVLTAALAGGLRRYALERGRPPGDLRAFVPVDLRRGAPVPPQLGNRFGLFLLTLPLGARESGLRLRTTRRTIDALKAGPMAVATYTTLAVLGVVPAAVQDLVVRFLATKGSAVLTNLPGPRQRVRIAGAELAGVVPWVPQAARVAIGISVFSYAGRIVVGVAGDEQVVPDPEGVLAAVQDELDELRRLLLGADLSSR